MANVRLFVYGSLKRGGLHHEELRGARFLAEARTTPGFGLATLRLGNTSYFALVRAPGEACSVTGEVFELPDEYLPRLDDFEGEEYERGLVRLEELEGTGALKLGGAVAYFKKSR